MKTVILPLVVVKVSETVTIPVDISDFPEGCSAFEMCIECDQDLLEITGIFPIGTMLESKAYTFNNSPDVYTDITHTEVSKIWKNKTSPSRVGINCADTYPLTGHPMFNLIAVGKADAKVVLTCTFLALGAEVLFGKKPEQYQVSTAPEVPVEPTRQELLDEIEKKWSEMKGILDQMRVMADLIANLRAKL